MVDEILPLYMKLIKLTQNKIAKISDQDSGRVNEHKWHFNKQGVAYRKNGKSIYMHRFIMQPPKFMEVDHKNGDILDNTRENLRICTHADNLRNRRINKKTMSGFKGVKLNGSKWQARITFNGKEIHLGQFETKEQAAESYNEAAKVYFGEFARLNEL